MNKQLAGPAWRGWARAALWAAAVVTAAPALGATEAPPAAPGMSASAAQAPSARKKAPPKPVKRIDINSASRAELKTLPFIDDAAATRLIAGRPYLTKKELVTKEVIPLGPYLSLKDRVIALQKPKPASKPRPEPKPKS